jgi:L-threonylcarbamoyladenylate synthase
MQQELDYSIDKAISVLQKGGVISFPTETYYGLGVDPLNEDAVRRLFVLKKREITKPILLLIEDASMLAIISAEIPSVYEPLMEKFWPGPLTLLFPWKKNISEFLTGGTGTIGVRVSSDPLVQKLFCKWKSPVTATSANISGERPASTAYDVKKTFGNKIDYIVDGGDSPAGLCSTIVGYQNGKLVLIRKGKVSFADIVKTAFPNGR